MSSGLPGTHGSAKSQCRMNPAITNNCMQTIAHSLPELAQHVFDSISRREIPSLGAVSSPWLLKNLPRRLGRFGVP